MILYHGSSVEVRKPRIINTNKGLDFGAGFYLTSDIDQATRWAVLKTKRRRSGTPTLSIFEFDESMAKETLSIQSFDGPSRGWLEYVVANRKGTYSGTPWDLVSGPVANDRTILTINDYVSGAINAETALVLLEPAKLTDQYAFLTYRALQTLSLVEVKNDVG